MPAKSVNRWLAERLISHAGGRAARLATRTHMLALYALGIGGATTDPRFNGERRLIEQLAGHDPVTVFDVGANLGEYAELALEVLGPGTAIHCFEPNPDAFEALEHRFGKRATLHQCALGGAQGTGTLHADQKLSVLASLYPTRSIETTISVRVNVETIDDICAKRHVDRIDLLKLDVEGAELEALRGAERLLRERRIGLIQFEFGQNSLEARAYMRDFYDLLEPSHRLFRVGPRGLTPLGPYRPALEIFESATNYAAVPVL